MDGVTLQPGEAHGLRDPQEEFGVPLFTIYRADLQNELMMLAAGVDMQLKARVSAVDCYERFVELDNGERYYGDLIIGADGVHSVLRAAVIGEQISPKAEPWDLSAFRFTTPTVAL
jgi:salicylate hydroxylase